MRATDRRWSADPAQRTPPQGDTPDPRLHALALLQRQAGNRAIASLLAPARVDPALPAETAAATTDGTIALNPRVALLGDDELTAVVRHERVHALHQRLAPGADESPAARAHAEALATRAEAGGPAPTTKNLLRPAPSVLTYVGANYGAFPRVWIGNNGIVGEVVVDGVPIRVFRSYDDLGIKQGSGSQRFECEPAHRDAPALADLAKRMTAVGDQVKEVNDTLPKTAAERVSVVTIAAGEEARYRLTAAGKGMIVIPDANADDAAHEASHGVFEFHAGTSADKPRAPTKLACRIAELYMRLEKTTDVPIPAGPFDVKAGRPGKTHGTKRPAGLVMVMDTLWAGSGGHPWDEPPSEFFASAHGAFAKDPALLAAILDYYETQDATIKTLRVELLELLEATGDEAKRKALAPPKDPDASKAMIGKVKPTGVLGPDTATNQTLLWLLDPSTMPAPASPAACTPAKAPAKGGTFGDVLE